jgi:hypothetical protein
MSVSCSVSLYRHFLREVIKTQMMIFSFMVLSRLQDIRGVFGACPVEEFHGEGTT